MATGGSEISSDEISDFQCFTCTNKTAVNYCVECQGYCCQGCVDAHSRFPALKGHKLLDISNGQTTGLSAKVPSVPTERCSKHAIKLLDMYCKNHDEVGCTTCIALDHRSCREVHSIPDEIDSLFSASDDTSIKQKIKQSKEKLNNVGKMKENLLKDLELSKIEAKGKIENVRKEIVDHIVKLEKKAKEEVQNLYITSKARLEKEKEDAKNREDNLGKILSDLQTSESNKAQMFVCMKMANRKIKEADEIEQKIMTEAYIVFDVNLNLQTSLKSLQTLGTVRNLNANTERTELYTVEKYKDMNVKLQHDSSSCDINDSCWTQDGALLLVDKSNKKLKRVNISTFTVDSYCSFDCCPWCVCCTPNNEAVVTFFKNKYIQFVSIGNKLIPSRKVTMNHNCFGIANKEDKLYISDNAQTLNIHDLAGNLLQTVSKDGSSNSLFTYSRQIAFNNSTKGIFVADINKGVIILDEHYQQSAIFSDSELLWAASVCTDGRGNVFVCGWGSHNVLQIGTDGSKRGVVDDKSHGIQCPQSVLFDTKNCRLIVTQNNDIVKIFDLK